MVAAGVLGPLRLVQVEYPQDRLAEPLEQQGHTQADWRTDPARSGAGGCPGDIDTHAYNLADYVTGLAVDQLCAELSPFVPGRCLDDNVMMMPRYQGGARGMLWASQVAPGHENGLKLRVYGSLSALEWVQAEPNVPWHAPLGQPRRQRTCGGASAHAAAPAPAARRSASHASRPAIPRAIWRASPTSTPRPHAPSAPSMPAWPCHPREVPDPGRRRQGHGLHRGCAAIFRRRRRRLAAAGLCLRPNEPRRLKPATSQAAQ